MYIKLFKRIFDIALSCAGLLVLAVPMLVIATIIRCEDAGPAIFRQERMGKDKKPFCLYKFRSMKLTAPHDTPTHLLESPERHLLKVGKFLRETSLDELPQLLNIIKGEMSLVGPRPALCSQEDLLAARDRCGANAVRPGLTGWAQINGRDELSIREKADLDGAYVANMGFGFDCKCFFGTFLPVLRRAGVREGGLKTGK